jgi:xanthine dehydrogenase accessory factor
VLEIEKPTAIRRSVSISEAVFDGSAEVEDIRCTRIAAISEMEACFSRGNIPILVDPSAEIVAQLKPAAVVDAIMAKRATDTRKDMAPATIGLGPGFRAGIDVHAVIETMRGHDLGRLILQGSAQPDTGVPGEVGGKSDQRVIHAPVAGEVTHIRNIGDKVEAGEAIGAVSGETVAAPFAGLLRGLLKDGLQAHAGMKIADIDPRPDVDWRGISDKARCIGGAALEAFFYLSSK